MIKVAIHFHQYEWEEDEPKKILSLSEFEESYKDFSNVYRIKFIVV